MNPYEDEMLRRVAADPELSSCRVYPFETDGSAGAMLVDLVNDHYAGAVACGGPTEPDRVGYRVNWAIEVMKRERAKEIANV